MSRLALVLALALALAGVAACGGSTTKLPTVLTDCGGSECVRVLPVVDSEGAPVNATTVVIPFDAPVRPGSSLEVAVVNAALDWETRQPVTRMATLKSLRVDPRTPRQLVLEVDSLLADGAAVAFGPGVVAAADGRPLPAFEVTLATPWSPLAVLLTGSVWEPSDPTLFSEDALQPPRGATADAAVRAELESRLRLRPGIGDDSVNAVLARYDSEPARKKVPDHRLRAGLMLLTGTSAEYAIDFILADTNRRGVPFEPLKVEPLQEMGAFAAVFYHPLIGKLRMSVDTEVARESLEKIAAVLTHEALHSGLGGDSTTEELLAMAAEARVYQEFLLWDPALAHAPTLLTRQENTRLLAIRNSGRFNYPYGGLLPRPGVTDALRGVAPVPVRSFRDFAFHPDFYGELAKAGDVGSEVLEAYYRTIARAGDQGHLRFDEHTLKLYDTAMDHGFTDEQLVAIADALRLRPVPIN